MEYPYTCPKYQGRRTQELSQIMSVILGRVLLRVIAGSQHSHFVPVDGVVVEKVSCLLVDLARTVLIAPQVQQLLVHGPRAQFGDLSQVLNVG